MNYFRQYKLSNQSKISSKSGIGTNINEKSTIIRKKKEVDWNGDNDDKNDGKLWIKTTKEIINRNNRITKMVRGREIHSGKESIIISMGPKDKETKSASPLIGFIFQELFS